jgi:hypothetical protein
MDHRPAPADFAPHSLWEGGRGGGCGALRHELSEGATSHHGLASPTAKKHGFSIMMYYQWVDPMHTRVHRLTAAVESLRSPMPRP